MARQMACHPHNLGHVAFTRESWGLDARGLEQLTWDMLRISR